MLETTVSAVMLVSLIFYAVMGGADFGGGMWDMLAFGKRAEKQRHTIAEAIGPIWEANHVWLILVVVLLFTGFPRAFSAMMIALHLPLTAMLIGIVFRGSTFVFRKYDSQADNVKKRWSTIFGISSFWTPFFQGLVLAALTSGEIRIVNGRVVSGFFAGWLSPFALTCGCFALALFAFLSAVYLTVDARTDAEIQNDFRARALWAQAVLVPLASIVFFTAKKGAPLMFQGLTTWWAPLLLGWTGLSAVTATVALWCKKYSLARIAAIVQVSFILLGWGVAQFPHLVAPDITVYNSAAPSVTLEILMIFLSLGAVILLPSLGYLFYIFKGKAE